MVRRGEIVWAELDPPAGRRPVCILTRDEASPVLKSITIAPLTSTIRGIPSEVRVGDAEGLRSDCAITCDNVQTLRKQRLDENLIGRLDEEKLAALDRALRFALAIRY